MPKEILPDIEYAWKKSEKSDCINVKALEMESTDKFILDRVKKLSLIVIY